MAAEADDSLRVYVLGSGSTGNALLVCGHGKRLLVDAGIGPRALVTRLRAFGVDLFPRGVDAIVVTHDHADHAGHLVPLGKSLKCPLWLHEGLEAKVARGRFEVCSFGREGTLALGDVRVETRIIPHDAPNVAVRITTPSGVIAYATDLGHVPKGLAAFVGASDLCLLESNHCTRMLAEGPYPEKLRRRISGGLGHLSNAQTGELVAAMGSFGDPLVALCHLSHVNNTPDRALATVREKAPEARLTVVEHGTPELLHVTPGPKGRRPEVQLTLGLG
jgi:phosphoribosyl 1,2-cyclic phosphodiesterase